MTDSVKLFVYLQYKLNIMDSKDIKRLPARLHELRREKQLTQKQMAIAIGISEAMYCRIESGERTIQQSQIDIVAKVLNADIKELRSLCLADRLEAETSDYSKDEIKEAFKTLNNGQEYGTE